MGKYLRQTRKDLTRKEAEQIIHLMSRVIEESDNKLIKNDFERLSDRLIELTRDMKKDNQ